MILKKDGIPFIFATITLNYVRDYYECSTKTKIEEKANEEFRRRLEDNKLTLVRG